MDDYNLSWALEQVLRQIYELSIQDTSRKIDIDVIKSASEAFLEDDGDSSGAQSGVFEVKVGFVYL